MWSHSSIRATAGPSVLLQTRRDGQRERLEGKRETVTMAHWYNGPAGISDILYRWASGKEWSALTDQRRGGGSGGQRDVSMFFSKLHKRREWRSKGWETEGLLLDCSSIRIFVVLPEERLQSCLPGAAVGVRNQMEWNEVQQTLMGFPSPDLMTAFWLNPLTMALEPVSNLGCISEFIISQPMLIIYVSNWPSITGNNSANILVNSHSSSINQRQSQISAQLLEPE